MKFVDVVDKKQFPSLIQFAQNFGIKPKRSEDLVEKFLTRFSSRLDCILDVHDDQGRLAIAVLLDRIQDPSNDIKLEILGVRDLSQFGDVFLALAEAAKRRVPKTKSGIQTYFETELYDTHCKILESGFKPYFQLFDMECSLVEGVHDKSEWTAQKGGGEGLRLESSWGLITGPERGLRTKDVDKMSSVTLELATSDSLDEIYDLIVRSCSKNPEIAIPEAEDWKATAFDNSRSKYWILKDSGRRCGFAKVLGDANGESEIRLVGVIPEARGQGFGRRLIRHCLTDQRSEGAKQVSLTVAAQNKGALGLYSSLGFRIVGEFQCFRWKSDFEANVSGC